MIAVTVARDDHGPWPGVALFHHDLVSDAPARRVEIDTLLLRKLFDLSIFGQVLFRLVLHVVVQRHDDLLGVFESRRTDRKELERNRPRVVVCHAMMRRYRHIVA